VEKVETSSCGRGESFNCSERSTLVPVGEAENAVDGMLAVGTLLVGRSCFFVRRHWE
jgi:hypothetical protein